MATKRTPAEIFESLKTKAEQQLEKTQKASTGKVETYDKEMATLKEITKKLTVASLGVEYDKLKKTENPFYEAIKLAKFPTYKAQEKKDEYGLKEVRIVAGEQRLDLKDFCLSAKLPTEWAKEIDKLRDLLEIRKKSIFELDAESLEGKSLFYASVSAKKKAGETPDSNTQIVKQLQAIFDSALGKGVHKCTNHDIAFVDEAATRFNPKGLAEIATMNSRQFRNIFLDVFSVALGKVNYKVTEPTQKKSK